MNCHDNNTATETVNCTGNVTNLQFYQDTLYTALVSLPGNIAGIILVSIIGGRIQLGRHTVNSCSLLATSPHS